MLINKANRDLLLNLEECMLEAEQVQIETKEYHCEGVYAREILISAGTALTGEIHLKDQINVLSKGIINVFTEAGGLQTLTAPCTFISPAGVKRAGYAVTDVVWTVFNATTSTNEADIRKEFIAPDYATLDKQLEEFNVLDSNGSSSDNRIQCGNVSTTSQSH